MKKIYAVCLSLLMILTGILPAEAAQAAEQGPQVTGWTVSTDHGGEVRNGTDNQWITVKVSFDQEIQIQDAKAAYDEFSVMLNGTIDITSEETWSNGTDWPVCGSLKRGEDGSSVVFELHYGYAPFASHLTIVPKTEVTAITGNTGIPAVWKDVDLYVPNGVTFTTENQTVGHKDTGTCASVTTTVYAPQDATRMMIHVLFLKNGIPVGTTDSYGSNLTTHFHDYLNLTAAGYADLFKGWFSSAYGSEYDISVSGEQITVTAKEAAEGEVLDLRVYAWPQDRDTQADHSALEAVLKEAESVDQTAYTEASVSKMKDQLLKAKAVDASVYYTQEEIDAAASSLQESVRALELKTQWNDDSSFPFTDVAADRWSRSAIVYAYNRKLFTGTDEVTFSPALPMNRAMLVTVLYRMDGAGSSGSRMPFADVAVGSYYYNAVSWAFENVIVTGLSDNVFGPDQGLTREQLAAILYRYAAYKGVSTSASVSLSGYQDASQISAYAEKPMQWAVAEGLISGISQNELSPLTGATREQVASILMRFCEKNPNLD